MRDIAADLIPSAVSKSFEICNWRNAAQILVGSYPNEWNDILGVLSSFRLRQSDIVAGGGGKSNISTFFDTAFSTRGWKEREVTTKVSVDAEVRESRTHRIDC